MPFYYVLDVNKRPVPTSDYYTWAQLIKNVEARRVAVDHIAVEGYDLTVSISTIFTGFPADGSSSAKPLLFETLVFNGELNHSMERYATWKEAQLGHQEMLMLVKNNLWVNRVLENISVGTYNTKKMLLEIASGIKAGLNLN